MEKRLDTIDITDWIISPINRRYLRKIGYKFDMDEKLKIIHYGYRPIEEKCDVLRKLCEDAETEADRRLVTETIT